MTDACRQLEAFLEGRLDAAAREAFTAHLAQCAGCAAEVARWTAARDRLKAWAAPSARPPTRAEVLALLDRAAGEPRARPWLGVALAATAAAVLVAVVAWRLAPRQGAEWELTLVDGDRAELFAGAALGSPDADRQFQLGPDELVVARAATVAVVEKTTARTRLRLGRGTVRAKVKHLGARQFVVESPPFVLTVVGTAFQASRDERGFSVETREGVVRVERLGADGSAVETHRVPAGEQLALPDEAATTADAGASGAEPDAGVADAGAPVEEAPPAGRPTAHVSPATLAAWRSRAARGECEAVLGELEPALARAPANTGLLRLSGDCARKLGEYKRALATYRRLAQTTQGADASEALLLAVGVAQDELTDDALVLRLTANLGPLTGAPPILASLHVRRAQALTVTGRHPEALKEVELVLRRYAETPAAAEAVRLKRRLSP